MSEPGFWQRVAWWWALVLLAVAVALIAMTEARALVLDDQLLLAAAQAPSGRALDWAMALVSLLGSVEVCIPLMLVLVLTAGRAPGLEGWRRWAPLLIMLALSAVELVLKEVVRQPGPPAGLARFSIHGVTVATPYSFPSGHMVRATMVFGVLALRLAARRRQARWLWACVALVWVIGYSRVYLGDHWPSDVAEGILLGGAGLAVTIGLAPVAAAGPGLLREASP